MCLENADAERRFLRLASACGFQARGRSSTFGRANMVRVLTRSGTVTARKQAVIASLSNFAAPRKRTGCAELEAISTCGVLA